MRRIRHLTPDGIDLQPFRTARFSTPCPAALRSRKTHQEVQLMQCEQCGRQYNQHQEVQRNGHHFCSQDCANQYQRNH